MSKDAQDLTVKDAAEKLGAGVSTVTLWCREKRFPNAYEVDTPRGKIWYIPPGDLQGVEIRRGRPPKPVAEKKAKRGNNK